MLREGGAEAGEQLTFMQADLSQDANRDQAVKGCTYVLHIASPTPKLHFKHEDEMIIPAREGVLRVLRSSRDAGVSRVVLTSAIGAIVVNHTEKLHSAEKFHWNYIIERMCDYICDGCAIL